MISRASITDFVSYIFSHDSYIGGIHFNYVKNDSPWSITSSLSSHIGLLSAKIHESYFGSWANLANLDPSRVQKVGSFYEFKGPVWIVASTGRPFWQKIFLSGLAFSLVSYLTFSLLGRVTKKTGKDQDLLIGALSLIAGLGAGYLAWNQLGKVIPATRGIFFYNWPI